ncbi:MAG: prepilin-type N-terminal cleavage/methylation domain-containing protein [Candidatus Eremiobacteraeota bacterium]|nr:prepilin-type N-terminal cleavage/methylation domain-containing protein [Candidatus Eremiobacteraeota bacterium]MCL5055267.1 prepilin-type N-terminal cleavage/methylation domain-containing protein [Bacillota bacterium]
MQYKVNTPAQAQSGFTLIELLIGLGLFSLILTMLAAGLEVSHKTLSLAEQQTALDFHLQNAMDNTSRMIRQATDVAYYNNPSSACGESLDWNGTPASVPKGAPQGLILTEADGSSVDLLFGSYDSVHCQSVANGILYENGSPIADGLQSVHFQINDSGVVKNVDITMTAEAEDSSGAFLSRTLVSSVSLRNVPPGTAGSSPSLTSSSSSSSSSSLRCITGHFSGVCGWGECFYKECYNSSGQYVSGYFGGDCHGPCKVLNPFEK